LSHFPSGSGIERWTKIPWVSSCWLQLPSSYTGQPGRNCSKQPTWF
jgi:hypothetical protein